MHASRFTSIAQQPQTWYIVNRRSEQLDDLNQSFSFSANSFDVVHSRLVAGGINRSRWQSYVRDIKKYVPSSKKYGRQSMLHQAGCSRQGYETDGV